MMTNFGIGLPTTPSFTQQLVDSQPSFTPQLVYSQNLDFVPSPDDTLPSFIKGADSLPAQFDGCEQVRVMVFGSSYGVTYMIRWLYRLQFAHISEWSFLMPAPSEGEFMSIITKRIPLSPTN
ncbi:hypothetical protein QUA43_13010 [Microcoleus sp. N9_B4]|jgi:hypothetical protein|uniref:hypothetical protein n=1 Tax=Microcoleus sp. N9_B4 TaxID=3055386 RepID=UPI002FCEB0B5